MDSQSKFLWHILLLESIRFVVGAGLRISQFLSHQNSPFIELHVIVTQSEVVFKDILEVCVVITSFLDPLISRQNLKEAFLGLLGVDVG